MINKQNETQSNVIYGYRAYENEIIMKFMRNSFYIFLNFFLILKLYNLAEYILITTNTKNKILSSKYSFPFLRMDIAFHKFKCVKINYKRKNRKFGKSNYNYFNLIKILLVSSIACSYVGIKLRLFNRKKKVKINLKKIILITFNFGKGIIIFADIFLFLFP